MNDVVVNPEMVFEILVKGSKHKKDRVFFNELSHFLNSDKDSYYFLSEDYYEHYLRREDGRLVLVVVSEKDEIVERVEKVNSELTKL